MSRGLLRSYRQGIRRQRLYLRRGVDALVRFGPARDARRSTRGRSRLGRNGLRTEVILRAEDWVGDS